MPVVHISQKVSIISVCAHVVDYRRLAAELREAGVAKEEWESVRRRLEEQLRRKDAELKIQEEEQARLKRTYVYLAF